VTAVGTPNYFDPTQRAPWLVIRFGGVPIVAALTKIDGVETEHKWKEQTSKETSNSVNVYAGAKVGHPELTFTSADEADFAGVLRLIDLLTPVPGLGTGAAPAPAAASAGSPYQIGGGGSASSGASSPADTSGSTSTASTTPNPGPRPPTVTVDYPPLRIHGITACALEKLSGPYFTATNGMELKIKLIPDKPPVPAGAGAMAPPPPATQYTSAGGGGADAGGAAGGNGSNTSSASSGAAGT
jgi:hypothetical protein